MKKNLIKKVSVLAVCAAMAFGVAACGGGAEEAPAEDAAVEEEVPADDAAVEEDAAAEEEAPAEDAAE